jgi:hypothetical protein
MPLKNGYVYEEKSPLEMGDVVGRHRDVSGCDADLSAMRHAMSAADRDYFCFGATLTGPLGFGCDFVG